MSDETMFYHDLVQVLIHSNAPAAIKEFRNKGLLKHDSKNELLERALDYLEYASEMRNEPRVAHPEFMPNVARLRGNFETEFAVYLAEAKEKLLHELEAKAAAADLEELPLEELN